MENRSADQSECRPYTQPEIVKQQKLSEVTEGIMVGGTGGGGAIGE